MNLRTIQYLAAILTIPLASVFGPAAYAASPIQWGVNGHPIHNPVFADYDKQFEVMTQNHLTTYRFDVTLTEDGFSQAVAKTRQLVKAAKKWGVTLRPVLQVAFCWGDRTDGGRYKADDPQALYRQGFNRTYDFVNLFKNDIQDWEMLNEINLRLHDAQDKPLYGYGWRAEEFDTPLMQDWSHVFQGMSDAIGKIKTDNGTSLRRILGTTSTQFGFLDYMQAQGVAYEVIVYHSYAHLEEDPSKAWSLGTPPYHLFQKLASYGKPVHVTEVNAAEIYNDDYANQDSDEETQKGNQSLNKTLGFLKNQRDMKLEEVDVYELLDDPAQKKPAERRFGLMYNLTTPKPALSILRHFSAEP